MSVQREEIDGHWLRVLLAAVLAMTVPMSAKAQPQPDAVSKESPAAAGANGESERDLVLPDPLDNPNEPEDRLVILPEIKRDGERYYLSSFKLPEKLTFAGQPVPLDNWQVRERIEYEFYQFLEDQGESIILGETHGPLLSPGGAPTGRGRIARRSEVHAAGGK